MCAHDRYVMETMASSLRSIQKVALDFRGQSIEQFLAQVLRCVDFDVSLKSSECSCSGGRHIFSSLPEEKEQLEESIRALGDFSGLCLGCEHEGLPAEIWSKKCDFDHAESSLSDGEESW